MNNNMRWKNLVQLQLINICGNLPQSASSQVEVWLPGNGYLATQQYKRTSRKHFYSVSLEPT
jgi:hypothetical protein